MGITIINKELTYHQRTYYLELQINDKIVEISVQEDYNTNADYISVDYDFIEPVELTDEESDEINEWVMSFEYDSVDKDTENIKNNN